MDGLDRLLKVCALLKEVGANYLVVGGYACILHGLVRTTKDVDILIEDEEENFQKGNQWLAKMADGAAPELSPEDFRENLVLKIADEVEADVSRRAWKLTYAEAIPSAIRRQIRGVEVPYVDLEALIISKTTYREQDAVDIARLRNLRRS